MDINKSMNRREALKCMGTLIVGAAIATTPLAAKVVTPKPARIKRLVFFFSATGNSLYVARSTFKADYFFTVGTFGAHSTIFPEFVDKFAKEHGVQMNYISTIQMVDTYLPYFDADREKADPKNQRIPERIAAILASINSRENYIQTVTQEDRMICEGYYRHSGRDRQRPTVTRSEKIVFSTDACVGCGVCTSVCPHGSWKVVDEKGVPEGDCENCLACVHNCPQKAISIIPTPPEPEEPNRNARYRNPNVKLGDLIKANSQN